MTAETAPTSVGLTLDQVLTLLATWLREQGLEAPSIQIGQYRGDGGWFAGFHGVSDEDLDEWAHALGRSLRTVTDGAKWWRRLDNRASGYPQIDGIGISVYGEHHDGPIPPELAAGDQS